MFERPTRYSREIFYFQRKHFVENGGALKHKK